MTPNALGAVLRRLRHRFGELLRAAVARSVTDPTQIDDELRHLLDVITA